MKVTSRALLFAAAILVLGAFVFSPAAGYVTASESEQRSNFAAPILVANSTFLNVRSGPGIQFTVLLTVVGGTELPVLGVANDRVWYQVSTVVGAGWVNVQYTLPRGNFTNVPLVEVSSFAQPDTSSSALPQGGMTGFVQDDAINTASFTSQREWGVSVIEPHPLRSSPSMNASSPGTAAADLSVILTLLEAASGEGGIWYRVDVPGVGIYWVEAAKTRARPYACSLSAVVFPGDVTPGIGPDGSGTLNGSVVVRANSEAYLLDNVNGQFKVELFDGSVGWISQSAAQVRDDTNIRIEYCTSGRAALATGGQTSGATAPNAAPSRPRLTTPVAVVNTGFLNLRSGPGAQFTIVATVAGGTELPVIGIYFDEVWLLVEGRFGRGWVNTEYVLFRGDGRSLPIIRDVGGIVAAPIALFSTTITVYNAPNVALGSAGTVVGPVELPIVARTADGLWVQVNTGQGFAWALVDQVLISGDLSLIPIVNG